MTAENQWFYVLNGKREGPVSETQLGGLIAAGNLTPDTQVWNNSMPSWAPARSTSLASLFQTTPPSVPKYELPSYWAGFALNVLIGGAGFFVIREYGRGIAWFLGSFFWGVITALIVPNMVVAAARANAASTGYIDPNTQSNADGLGYFVWFVGAVIILILLLVSYRSTYRRKYGV
ncbi:MAG: hypothetical protein C4332_08620 [Meiothermus sp.]